MNFNFDSLMDTISNLRERGAEYANVAMDKTRDAARLAKLTVALTGESVRMELFSAPDNMWFDFFVFKVGGKESRRIGNVFQNGSDVIEWYINDGYTYLNSSFAEKILGQGSLKFSTFNSTLYTFGAFR